MPSIQTSSANHLQPPVSTAVLPTSPLLSPPMSGRSLTPSPTPSSPSSDSEPPTPPERTKSLPATQQHTPPPSVNVGRLTASNLSTTHLAAPSRPRHMSTDSFAINVAGNPYSTTGHTNAPSANTFTAFRKKRTPISLQFDSLSLTLPDGKVVLSGVTGEFPHSKLLAIMGPSGAGKTSFLNALAGRATYGTVSGSVLINHIPARISDVKHLVGFVPQDDILHADLTVEENIWSSATLRLPAEMSLDRKKEMVNDVLMMLGLDEIRTSRVGSVERRGISGGQRKRVNIGMELVSDPAILFMDEPTSGLDASAALSLLHSLHSLAKLGLTIITCIHQPRYTVFSSFHTVLLLAMGGRTAYLGATADALAYFHQLGFILPDHENPADFFLDVISGVVRREGSTSADDSTVDFAAAWVDFQAAQTKQRSRNRGAVRKISSTYSPIEGRPRASSNASNSSVTSNSSNSALSPSQQVHSSPSLQSRALAFISPAYKKKLEDDKLESLFSQFRAQYAPSPTNVSISSPLLNTTAEAQWETETPDIASMSAEEKSNNLRFKYIQSSSEHTSLSCSLLGCCSFHTTTSLQINDADERSTPSDYHNLDDHLIFGLPTPRTPPSIFSQFTHHLIRMSTKVLRQPLLIAIDVMLIMFLALVVGLVYGSNWTLGQYTSQSVFSTLAIGLCACVASLRFFSTDRLIFWRESQVGISKRAYFFALLLVELHRMMLYPLVFCCVYYPMARPASHFYEMYLIFASTYFCMAGLGLFLSVTFRPLAALMIAVMLPLTVGGFFSGANPPLVEMHWFMRLCSDFSFTRWTIESLGMNEANHPEVYGAMTCAAYQSGYGWDQHPLMKDCLILIGMGFAWRILCGIGIWRFSRNYKP